MGLILETSDDNFNNDVIRSTSEYILVDFYAPWCGPCKMLSPVLEEISKEFVDIKFIKVNVDENPHLSQNYGISGVPSIIMFKQGKVIAQNVGALNKEGLRNFIKSNI